MKSGRHYLLNELQKRKSGQQEVVIVMRFQFQIN